MLNSRESVKTAKGQVAAAGSLLELTKKAANCRNCDLWRNATQTVFGEGRPNAQIMLIGEQPGNDEDKKGRPFVGPAGRLLDSLLAEAGIDRTNVYVTNVVKHFKWKPRGKRRIHKKPGAREIAACSPWIEAEVAQVKPQVIVCLGASGTGSFGTRISSECEPGKIRGATAGTSCDGYSSSLIDSTGAG